MIPKKVYICGIPHTVKLTDDHFNTDLHFGQIDYGKAEIKINKNITDELKEQTLIHEMLHGILVYIGRNEESLDEQLVQALSNALYQSFMLKNDPLEGRKINIEFNDIQSLIKNVKENENDI